MHILVFLTDTCQKISSITFLKRDSITEALLAVLKNSRNTDRKHCSGVSFQFLAEKELY